MGEPKPHESTDERPCHSDKPCPTGNGTKVAWSVEVRYDYTRPEDVCGQILDNRWRPLIVFPASIGVPRGPRYDMWLYEQTGTFSYAAAQALRWWFHAQAESAISGICLESRLVRHRLKYSYEAQAESVHCLISGEDRSSIMPDWGEKEPAQTPAPAK